MSGTPFADRQQAGKALRQSVPRTSHGDWTAREPGGDVVAMLEQSNAGRLPELAPIRFGRMLQNPFAFLRGAPAVMACDLAGTPVTGLTVQACGDCHLVNFGVFASPERKLVFDINDFDETLRGPWEWDVKRLAASLVVAARVNGFSEERATALAVRSAASYRLHMHEFAAMSPVEVWYFHIDAHDLVASATDEESRRLSERMASKARQRVGERLFPKITEPIGDGRQFVESPPLTKRVVDERALRIVRHGIGRYLQSLDGSRRFLLERYRLEDYAMRVVGIGSVGTRCFVALLVCDDRTPLLLQIKEARPSVLAPYAEPSPYANQGQRVVAGQRMIQATSDIFLGWLRARDGHDYFVRQLRDMKYSVAIDALAPAGLDRYAELCGWTLAGAHARSGDAAAIDGYLGGGDQFDTAIGKFAVAYADQTERDHAALEKAWRAGRLVADTEAV
ncbi:MAG: DUF2252 domain-containing protein [Planctomycetia bacterium]|jgi:uncharacterized protein (DUF2252 family)